MIIGITGGIGSGKSTIAQELVKRGFVVYDCDRKAKRIVAKEKEIQAAIIQLLGEEAFTRSHIYNTAFVAKRVFDNPELLQALNAIIHPAVRRDIEQKQPDFVESAILYESGFDILCNKVVVIDAPEEIRIERVLHRDYAGEASEENIRKVRTRIHAQHIPQGDLILQNDGHTAISELADAIIHFCFR